MNILANVDRKGLPLSVSTYAANHHEVRCVQLWFDFDMIEAKPEKLVRERLSTAIGRTQISKKMASR